MNPMQALEMLDRVCSQVSMNRADHLNCTQAVETLRAFIVMRERPLGARAISNGVEVISAGETVDK